MRGVKIIILAIAAAAFVMNGWVYLAWLSFERTLLSDDFIRETVEETGLAEAAHAELQGVLESDLPGMLRLTELAGDSGDQEEEAQDDPEVPGEEVEVPFAEAWETEALLLPLVGRILADTFDPGWIEEQLLYLAGGLTAYTRGESTGITSEVNMLDRKEYFKREMVAALNAFPQERLERHGLADAELQVETILAALEIPDYFDLKTFLESHGILSALEDLMVLARETRGLMLYWPLVLHVLLLLLAVILAGPAGGLKLSGISTILSGLSALLAVQYLRVALSVPLPDTAQIVFAGQFSLTAAALNAFSSITATAVTFPPLIFSVVGLVLLGAGIAAEKKD